MFQANSFLRRFALGWCFLLVANHATGQERGKIHGQLIDQQGAQKQVASVAVFVCNSTSGFPLIADGQVFSFTNAATGIPGLLHAVTDADGAFEMRSVPPGKYRLVAQAWTGRDSVPSQKDADTPIELHGFARDVEVEADRVTHVEIRELGSAVLDVQNDPDEGNNYLFVSLKSPVGEPVLGPMFWGDDFIHNIVGITHQKRGKARIKGLPNNVQVHLAVLNYDNNAGIGGVTAHTRQGQATLPIYATWSNGYYQPPERLQTLVDWMQENKTYVPDLLSDGNRAQFHDGRQRLDYQRYYKWIQENADKTRNIEGVGEYRVVDLAAAEAYRRFIDAHEARQAARR